MFRKPLLHTALALSALGLLAACADADSATSASTGGASTGDADRPTVAASFYPLEYVTGRIGGDRIDVTNLTPPGAEPHDLELSPKDVAAVTDAEAVIYLTGFQPAVDEAVQAQAGDRALDVASAADLNLTVAEEGETGTDPHFWLDPQRLGAVAGVIEARLTQLDPDGASTFQANLATLNTELEALDGEFQTGLASCTSTDLVTSHEAFGYLAARYGLTQVGISGLSPEEEPTPDALARVSDFVRDNKVRTIYYETLISPAIAETVASETGAVTAVLDPLEGISPDSQGADYFAIMRSNLTNLKEGQPCS